MKVICVDDEKIMLDGIMMTCREIPEIDEVIGFRKPMEALDYVGKNEADIIFLDIDMPVLDGMTLARKIKKIKPTLQIIFTTGYSEFAIEAFKMKATGYLMKPVKKSDIIQELESLKILTENLKYFKVETSYSDEVYDIGGVMRDEIREAENNEREAETAKTTGTRNGRPQIFARTFGNFDLLVDKKPVVFSRKPAKELLAYLIDKRGATVSRKEMAAVVFEDDGYNRSTQSYLTKLLSDMIETLKSVGAENMVLKNSGMYYVDVSAFSCDLYDYLDGKVEAINRFRGEYMSQYSWAEGTLGEMYGDD